MRKNLHEISSLVSKLVREHRGLTDTRRQAIVEVSRECDRLHEKAGQLATLGSSVDHEVTQLRRELAEERCRSGELEAQLDEAAEALEDVKLSLGMLLGETEYLEVA